MWKDLLEEMNWKNRYVAVWTFGWVYRGLLAHVGDQALVLKDACAVEETGAANNKEPKQETPIPSDVIISLDCIENICIPTWANFKAKLKERTDK
jgi:hypothetical protein